MFTKNRLNTEMTNGFCIRMARNKDKARRERIDHNFHMNTQNLFFYSLFSILYSLSWLYVKIVEVGIYCWRPIQRYFYSVTHNLHVVHCTPFYGGLSDGQTREINW